jgi:hypothetical protein
MRYYPKIRQIDDTISVQVVKGWWVFEFFVMEVGKTSGVMLDRLLDSAEEICERLNGYQDALWPL